MSLAEIGGHSLIASAAAWYGPDRRGGPLRTRELNRCMDQATTASDRQMHVESSTDSLPTHGCIAPQLKRRHNSVRFNISSIFSVANGTSICLAVRSTPESRADFTIVE